jgi:hypothetical protein
MNERWATQYTRRIPVDATLFQIESQISHSQDIGSGKTIIYFKMIEFW